MPNNSRFHHVYARLLQDHPYGWTLYKKFTTDDLYPGCCGYFDSDGDWHYIVELTAGKDLVTSRGWTAPDDEFKPSSLIWGPKKSRSVISHELGGEVAANISSPISPSPKMVFICEKDEGAVLTIQNPVLRHRIYDESATLKWVKENRVGMLRRHRKIVEQHGVWVVNKTYTTARSGVVVMFSNSSTVEIGIGAAVPGMVTLTPLSSWTSGKGDLATEVHDDSNGVVVFMSGIYFSKKRLRAEVKPVVGTNAQNGKLFRGGYVEPDSDEFESENECNGLRILVV
ncbi:hypothetical protein QC761_512280 [Podospora bellae-mahoneyi]|uniref:Uncharacterized protein n=1 Tax=Podospora bellae-mahoneyi TaxID=2093777 RepID=A0ABR0FGW8_9PEZI|nr:hypothetical protein QC761_512280 [Podospora bellae-mahoneyi]